MTIKYLKNISLLVFFLCFLISSRVEAVWNLPAVPISSTNSSNPEIGIDASGNAVAVWQESDGSNTIIMGATLPFNGSWTTPVTLSLSGEDASIPQVAVDPQGNAVAVWKRSNGTNTVIQGAVLPFGASSWTPTADLSLPGKDADVPQVAVDPNGNAVAVWARLNSLGREVTQGAILAFGSLVWTPTSDLSASTDDTFVPQVSVDAQGNAVAVWSNVTSVTIQAATLSFGSLVWSPFTTLSGTQAGVPVVAVNAGGYAIAAWGIFNGTNFVIQSATLPFGGSWSAPLTVSGAGNSSTPDVAIDTAGNAVAVWFNNIGSDIFTQAATLAFGASSWSAVTTLTNPGEQAFDQRVRVDGSGNAIAVWDNTIGSDTLIQAAMLPAGGSWSVVTTLSSVGEVADFPQIAIAPAGYAVVDWTNETQTRIFSITWTAPPTVTNVNPDHGPTTGGNTVIITGTNFTNATTVKFGANNALSFTVLSQTMIRATVPPGAVGTVDVTVTTPAGTSAINPGDHYTYVIVPPPPKPPHPPKNFHGKLVKKLHHPHGKYFFLTMWWTKPHHHSNIAYYHILENGKVIKKIKAHKPHVFRKYVRSSKHLHKRYKIVSVSFHHLKSKRKKLNVVKIIR